MLHYDTVLTYIFRDTGRRWGNLYLWGREVRSFGMCLINVEIEEVPWIFLQHVSETSTGLGSYKYILRSKSLCILCMKRYNWTRIYRKYLSRPKTAIHNHFALTSTHLKGQLWPCACVQMLNVEFILYICVFSVFVYVCMQEFVHDCQCMSTEATSVLVTVCICATGIARFILIWHNSENTRLSTFDMRMYVDQRVRKA